MIATTLAVLACSGGLAPPRSILVFTKTTGFRHDSIPAAKAALAKACQELAWKASFTENGADFHTPNLKDFSAVVFLLTTGDVLDAVQQAAMEGFVRDGGGYVGVHSASDTEYDWEWYGRLVGAYFRSHPPTQQATVHIEDGKHQSTKHLPNAWVRTDEWYDFRANPRPNIRVLATVDESTYTGGLMGKDHPIIWCHEFGGGRSWYTAMGHTAESYADPLFMRSLTQGIDWVCRRSAK
jgi:type 1 glutamine amidotransferase